MSRCSTFDLNIALVGHRMTSLAGRFTFVYALRGTFMGGGIHLWAEMGEIVGLEGCEILLL